MAIQMQPQGRGQHAVYTGRNNGWSKHAKFDRYGNYVGQFTKKQTNQKRKNNGK